MTRVNDCKKSTLIKRKIVERDDNSFFLLDLKIPIINKIDIGKERKNEVGRLHLSKLDLPFDLYDIISINHSKIYQLY